MIPKSVTKPTSEPIEIHPPLNITAITPPINAKGRFIKVSPKLRREPNAIYSNNKTIKPTNIEWTVKLSLDLAFSAADPVISK